MAAKKSAEIAAEIERSLAARERIIGELDAVALAGKPQLVALAGDWIDHHVERMIEWFPDRIQALGPDGIREMKLQIAELKDSLPALADALFASKKLWPHRNSEPVRIDTAYWSDLFRQMISGLGSVLGSAGLLSNAPPGYKQPLWESAGGGRFRYRAGPGSSFDARKTAFAGYAARAREAQNVVHQVEVLQKALETAKARELWESA